MFSNISHSIPTFLNISTSNFFNIFQIISQFFNISTFLYLFQFTKFRLSIYIQRTLYKFFSFINSKLRVTATPPAADTIQFTRSPQEPPNLHEAIAHFILAIA